MLGWFEPKQTGSNHSHFITNEVKILTFILFLHGYNQRAKFQSNFGHILTNNYSYRLGFA